MNSFSPFQCGSKNVTDTRAAAYVLVVWWVCRSLWLEESGVEPLGGWCYCARLKTRFRIAKLRRPFLRQRLGPLAAAGHLDMPALTRCIVDGVHQVEHMIGQLSIGAMRAA